ncbi:MAG: MtrB/PioB family outer membrane beta-barrel protein [Verrucomicrobia bacterium]|nr:MtrB/PioB family outer membrane beta-barrel protein [Verrucomicrobiota bacterium]
MKTIFRLTLTALAAAAAARLVASPFATTSAGVGTTLSNKETSSVNASRSADPEWAAIKHTPTGQMFKWPLVVPKLEDIAKSASGWEYSGQLEVGYIGGDADERNARYRMYQDFDQGAYVNNFDLAMKKADGSFFGLSGGAAGRRDQYYGVNFGRANSWTLKLYFSETPHVFTDSYKTLWSGLGTGNLVLLTGLTPGGTASTTADNAAVAAAAANSANRTSLSLTRKRYGARLDLTLSAAWKVYASYALEERKGARPLGAVWGNNGGTAPIEIPEPVDYDTKDLSAGVTYAAGLNAFNFRWSSSIFDNKIDTLTFQEPYRIAPQGFTTTPAAGAYVVGRFDLTPSNTSHNARAEYTRKLPDLYNGSITAVVAAGTWRQNDNLIPYTTVAGITSANVTILPGGDWSSVGSLSRPTARGKIDTRTADLTLSLNPSAELNVKLKGRFNESDNNSDPYYAVNPNAVYVDADAATAGAQTRGLSYAGLTGVWGRPLNDATGSGGVLFAGAPTPTGSVVISNKIYSSKQYRFGPTADYLLSKTANFTGSYERDTVERTNRERAKVWDDRFKLGYVNRALPLNSTLRTSYEYGQRRGSRYLTAYYEDAMSAAIIAMPTTVGTNVTSWAVRNNGALRNYELSDRNQHIVNVRLDTMLRPNLDAGLSFQFRESRYPDAAFGRAKDSSDSANLDLNYQPSPKQNIYSFYSYQQSRVRQASIQQAGNVTIGVVSPLGVITPENAATIGSTPGGPFYSLGNAWGARSTDRNHVAGLGFKQELGKATFNLDYSYTLGRTRLAYQYAIGGAINAANAVFAGDRVPDMAMDASYLDASLRFPLTPRLSARLVYRNQWETIRDWHYRNLDGSPVVAPNPANAPTVVGLDGGPMAYRVNWYGVMFQIKL